jgi:hypothetical protein
MNVGVNTLLITPALTSVNRWPCQAACPEESRSGFPTVLRHCDDQPIERYKERAGLFSNADSNLAPLPVACLFATISDAQSIWEVSV